MMAAWKIGPALAAGNTVVAKPSEFTSISLVRFAKFAVEECGLPKGVFNVVTGSAQAIGAELTGNPLVRKITFTGSTEIGRLLMKQCADTVKKVSLELGGNALPFFTVKSMFESVSD